MSERIDSRHHLRPSPFTQCVALYHRRQKRVSQGSLVVPRLTTHVKNPSILVPQEVVYTNVTIASSRKCHHLGVSSVSICPPGPNRPLEIQKDHNHFEGSLRTSQPNPQSEKIYDSPSERTRTISKSTTHMVQPASSFPFFLLINAGLSYAVHREHMFL